MAMRQSLRFQLRLITCHAGGVVAEFAAMPHLLAAGLEMDNVVLAWIMGAVLFLILATTAGLIWRRSIMTRPARWAVAAPPVLAVAIYVLVRSLGGSDPADHQLAMETALVGGLCALFSAGLFLLWMRISPARPQGTQSGARR